MIRSLKFSQTEKVLVGAFSIVALGAGMVVVDSQPSGRAFAIESSVDSDLGAGSTISVDISDTGSDFPTTTLFEDSLQVTESDQSAQGDLAVADTDQSSSTADHNDSNDVEGDIEEEISVTIDGEEIDPADFDTNDVSVDVENKDTLEDSDNDTSVEVDRSTRQRTRNNHDVDNDLDADANIGDNDISGNENTGRIHPGDVKFNFTFPN